MTSFHTVVSMTMDIILLGLQKICPRPSSWGFQGERTTFLHLMVMLLWKYCWIMLSRLLWASTYFFSWFCGFTVLNPLVGSVIETKNKTLEHPGLQFWLFYSLFYGLTNMTLSSHYCLSHPIFLKDENMQKVVEYYVLSQYWHLFVLICGTYCTIGLI